MDENYGKDLTIGKLRPKLTHSNDREARAQRPGIKILFSIMVFKNFDNSLKIKN